MKIKSLIMKFLPSQSQNTEEDFSIASMLKDLRNDKSNNVVEDDINEEDSNQF